MLDPVLIGMGVQRHIYFMAKSEFFTDRGFFVKTFMRLMGAFPIKRNNPDIKSISNAVSLLQRNKQIGIFPQGKIVKNNNDFNMKSGAALLSVKTNVPVLPVSIYTQGKVGLFSKITVTFGCPIYLSGNNSNNSVRLARQLTQKIKERISVQLEMRHCQ